MASPGSHSAHPSLLPPWHSASFPALSPLPREASGGLSRSEEELTSPPPSAAITSGQDKMQEAFSVGINRTQTREREGHAGLQVSSWEVVEVEMG